MNKALSLISTILIATTGGNDWISPEEPPSVKAFLESSQSNTCKNPNLQDLCISKEKIPRRNWEYLTSTFVEKGIGHLYVSGTYRSSKHPEEVHFEQLLISPTAVPNEYEFLYSKLGEAMIDCSKHPPQYKELENGKYVFYEYDQITDLETFEQFKKRVTSESRFWKNRTDEQMKELHDLYINTYTGRIDERTNNWLCSKTKYVKGFEI